MKLTFILNNSFANRVTQNKSLRQRKASKS
jgi:hypothetical protein